MIVEKEKKEKNAKVVYTSGKNATLGDALKNAKPIKKARANGNGDAILPNLNEIDIAPLSDEEVAEKAKKAQERAQWALGAAAKLAEIRGEIAKLEAIEKAGGALVSEDMRRLAWLRSKEQELMHAGDESVQGHVAFAAFLEEIRHASRTVVNCKKYAGLLVSRGHYRIAGKAEHADYRKRMKAGEKDLLPIGARVVDGVLYLPAFKVEDKSAGQRAVEAEFVRFVRETYKDLAKAAKAHECEIEQEGGNADLSVLNRGGVGIYIFKNSTDKDKRQRGTLRVEVYEHAKKEDGEPEKYLRVIGAGGQRFLNLNDCIGTTFVRFGLFKTAQPLPFSFLRGGEFPDGNLFDKADFFESCLARIPSEKRDGVLKLIIAVKAIIKEWFSTHSTPEPEPAETE